MKIALNDLQMFVDWCKSNSLDTYCIAELHTGKIELRVSTPDNEVVTITVFDSDSNLQAKITTQNYLKYVLPKSK